MTRLSRTFQTTPWFKIAHLGNRAALERVGEGVTGWSLAVNLQLRE